MPIVTPGGGGFTGITVEIQGKIDDLERKLIAANKDIDQFAAHNDAASKAAEKAAKTATMSWTDFRSMYRTVLDVVRVGQQVWASTGEEYVNYAEQVKNLSRNIGTSAEDASKLIQISDDVRISYSSLSASLKLAQKGGIDVSIDGLKKLADQYNALAPGIERTQFLMKTFGRNGLEMGKLLEQGAAGIEKMTAAIDENLIMTAEGIKISDQYQKSVDELSDSFLALKVTAGSYLVGPATGILNHYRDVTTSLKENGYWYTLVHQLGLKDIKTKREEADAAFLAAQANGTFSDSLDELSVSLEEQNKKNAEFLSLTQNIGNLQQDYTKNRKKAIQDLTDAQDNLSKSIIEYGAYSKEALSAEEDVQKAQKNISDLEAAWHEATNKIIFDMVNVKLSVGGLTDAEFGAELQIGKNLGIFDQAAVDMAQSVWDTVDALVAGVDATNALAGAAEGAASAFQSMQYSAPIGPTMSGAPLPSRSTLSRGVVRRDTGGSGVAGTPYMIGTGAQPEMFIPSTNGTFVPNADKKGMGGTTYNIVINNPKKEVAENSIRKSLKSLSYTGVAA